MGNFAFLSMSFLPIKTGDPLHMRTQNKHSSMWFCKIPIVKRSFVENDKEGFQPE